MLALVLVAAVAPLDLVDLTHALAPARVLADVPR